METIIQFFDINNIFFTFLGYPISYLEFSGTVFNLIAVLLAARRNILTWPFGIIGVILFGVLFYKINLYADFFEQIFYFTTGLWGWYLWQTTRRIDKDDAKIGITTNSSRVNLYWFGGIVTATALVSFLLFNIHSWLPTLFPNPASLPVLDAVTTVASFAAQILMMRRKLESWWLWIAVDIVAIGLYWYKEVPFVSLLYLIFLINAFYGYYAWRRSTTHTQTLQPAEA